jgi:hypothetical protein
MKGRKGMCYTNKWDENRQGFLSKSRGQFLRMRMLKQAVHDALNVIKVMKSEERDPLDINDDDLEWRTCSISTGRVKRAAALMDYLIEVC